MAEILQRSLPYDVNAPRALPGIQPLEMADWLIVDEAYSGQVARRRELLQTRREDVLELDEAARPAALELMDLALGQLFERPGFVAVDGGVSCPDGTVQPIDRDDPLATLGRIAQEDFCLLQKQGDEHVMTGALLCFPASWSLDEKFMRPLVGIHEPVDSYDENIARRVQRLFNGVRADRPLWRFNALWYHDAELFQPRRENARRVAPEAGQGAYLRSEKQSILRLPESDAVVFSIHTFVVRSDL